MHWDKKLVGELTNRFGFSHEQAQAIVGIIAEEKQIAYMEGYKRGYNQGYDDGKSAYQSSK